jgi:ethanolamine utilization protein EutA
MSTRRINSVGIDVGTTTTQVIFSSLELTNRAAASQVPRYEFSQRDITYVSPVVFTPLDNEGQIRVTELAAFVETQYRAAHLTHEQVESGAIIVTGETSKARNARQTVMELAESLGDFVVATAGPHLESIIAGHGSGAGEYSRINSARPEYGHWWRHIEFCRI